MERFHSKGLDGSWNMKVISLTEPFATLIKIGTKRIETRSWATSYRGELYIHASQTSIPKKWKENQELMMLLKGESLGFGFLLCKCQLVDCIYMTEDFIADIQTNKAEYISGDYKVGRYAWILETVEVLECPIRAKGQLGVWNYYDEREIMKLMDQIQYGWVDQNDQKHLIMNDSYSDTYKLQSPKQLEKTQLGTCWDQVELQRYYFKNHAANIHTYFICYYGTDQLYSHTFLTYEKEDKVVWFEHAWNPYAGIHIYHDLEELISDVKEKFIVQQIKEPFSDGGLLVREYSKPHYGITFSAFFQHCEKGNIILV